MDWLLTVQLVLMEFVLVMKLPPKPSPEQSQTQCITLGVGSAVMIILGYPGELIVEGNPGPPRELLVLGHGHFPRSSFIILLFRSWI